MYGKPLRLSFAKKLSDVTAKMRGTFDESVKVERQARADESLRNKETKRQRKLIDKLLLLRQQVKMGPGSYKTVMRPSDVPFAALV